MTSQSLLHRILLLCGTVLITLSVGTTAASQSADARSKAGPSQPDTLTGQSWTVKETGTDLLAGSSQAETLEAASNPNNREWAPRSLSSRAWPEPEGSIPSLSPTQLRKLMRPTIDLAGEWQAEQNDVSLSSYDGIVKFPTFPLFGPPPPIINLGFNYTDVGAPIALGLPDALYQTEVGLSWMRRLNERWMTRLMGGVSYATDGENGSSDVWRFRGGAFAIYRRNPQWTWTFGAFALGRNDIPVVPAVGLIYQPHPGLRYDLIMPRPRISMLVRDNGPRQQWCYVGAGLNGATWGVRRPDGADDQLTYGDFRFVLGWESIPTPEPGMPFTRGRKLGAEVGYAFSRDFEFEEQASKIRLDDTLMIRSYLSF